MTEQEAISDQNVEYFVDMHILMQRMSHPFLTFTQLFLGIQFTLRCHNQVITSCLNASISPMGSDLRFGVPILFA